MGKNIRAVMVASLLSLGLVQFLSLPSDTRASFKVTAICPTSTRNPVFQTLATGQTLEREFKGGETHVYPLKLKAGFFLDVEVKQQGINVVVRLIGPDGKNAGEANKSAGTKGPESLTLITDKAGTYRLEVEPVEKNALAGKYEIKLEALRVATAQDQVQIEINDRLAQVETFLNDGKLDEALAVAQSATERAGQVFGAESVQAATCLNSLAISHWFKGDTARAETLFQQCLAIREKLRGAEHLETIESLNGLGALYQTLKKVEQAKLLLERALAAREKVLGDDDPEAIETRNRLGLMYSNQRDFAKAEPLLVKNLTISEKVLGPDHLQTATYLNNLAQLYQFKGEYQRAEPLYQRAIANREKNLGPDHLEVATTLNNLAHMYLNQFEFAKAEPLLRRALTIREKALGPDHSETLVLVANLAIVSWGNGNYEQAETLFRRCLASQEKTLGPTHPRVVSILNNLAMVYRDKGDLTQAEQLYQQALLIKEKTLPPTHPDLGLAYSNLAMVYFEKGEYPKAENLFLKGAAIREKVLGPNHPDLGQTLNNLAVLYKEKGDFASAEPLYRRVLEINEKALGSENTNVAVSLNNLAVLYDESGEFSKAEPYLKRALAIWEKTFGPDHPNVGLALRNLAGHYDDIDDTEAAERLYQQSLSILEKALGPDHIEVAGTLSNLGSIYQKKGDEKAEPLFERALGILEKALGPDHPDVAQTLGKLAGISWAKGNTTEALNYLVRSNETIERDLKRNLISGSERQKVLYLRKTSGFLDSTLSLQAEVDPGNQEALRAAMTVVLRRKGRALDAMAETFATLRRQSDPETQTLLDEYANLTSQISTLTLKGPGKNKPEEHQAYIKKLEVQKEKLENDISRRSVEFAVQTRPVTVEAVQQLIPADAALVEFAVYRLYDAKTQTYGAPHYGVYVLTSQGVIKSADLGETEPIDAAIAQLRQALRNSKMTLGDRRNLINVTGTPQTSETVMVKARVIDQLILAPVRKLIGAQTRLLISPDGDLNLIPFAALVTERGKFLVEDYLITYLTSGRDLLRLQTKLPSQQPPLVVANPDYAVGTGPKVAGQSVNPLSPLPGTGREGLAIQKLFADTRLVLQADATTDVVKNVHRPELLHIATHGYFLKDVQKPASGEVERGAGQNRSLVPGTLSVENPLLRSCLFFAGANRGGETNNGILTALEAAQLDLWGTKLVVLSACDTGVGEVKTGDGVYGMRRALVLSGSAAQMISLWPVSDLGTRELMAEYYTRLKAGEGRSEALRHTQIKMLKDPRRRHPFYWASFIQSGEWRPL
ncbi:MAG: tetratricopeptide repeat protein [Acidobacteria bacterium]|nr:tetratricopeptide repeat protein [Acidobacteriota bacterium]